MFVNEGLTYKYRVVLHHSNTPSPRMPADYYFTNSILKARMKFDSLIETSKKFPTWMFVICETHHADDDVPTVVYEARVNTGATS